VAVEARANFPKLEMVPSEKARERFPTGTPELSRSVVRHSIGLSGGYVVWIEEWNVTWRVPVRGGS